MLEIFRWNIEGIVKCVALNDDKAHTEVTFKQWLPVSQHNLHEQLEPLWNLHGHIFCSHGKFLLKCLDFACKHLQNNSKHEHTFNLTYEHFSQIDRCSENLISEQSESGKKS